MELGQTPITNLALQALQTELAAEATRVLRLILEANGSPNTIRVGDTGLFTDPVDSREHSRGPVLTILKDTTTGKIYYGQNHTYLPSPLESTLAKLVMDRLADESAWKRQTMKWGKPGQHSEVFALNDALLARDAAKIPVCDFSEFVVFNVYSNNYPRTGKIGDPIVRCGNCRAITGAMVDLSYGPNVLGDGPLPTPPPRPPRPTQPEFPF